jgi:ornithine decarboxylase
VNNLGAEWPLSRKFGCSANNAVTLMSCASDMGLIPYGLSFHVGSQQMEPASYISALAIVETCMKELKSRGIEIQMLNLGGGYPIRYREDVDSIHQFGTVISRALNQDIFQGIKEFMIEPGRFLVGNSAVIITEVVLVARKDPSDDVRWVYLDIGRFGGLAETEGESIKYHIEPMQARSGGVTGQTILAGPTCDSTDTLYEKFKYLLPLDLKAGERLLIADTGAYVTTYATQGFNGFTPLMETYIGTK